MKERAFDNHMIYGTNNDGTETEYTPEHKCDECGEKFASWNPEVIATQWGDGIVTKNLIICDSCDIDRVLEEVRGEDIAHEGFSREIKTTLNECK